MKSIRSLLESFRLLQVKFPKLRGFVPLPSPTLLSTVKTFIPDSSDITLSIGDSINVLQAADVGILKSGTSNLQAAFLGLPFVMFFKAPKFTEFVVRNLVKIKQYSPVNVVRPNTATELLQEDASPERIAKEIEEILTNRESRDKICCRLREVTEILSSSDSATVFHDARSAYERVASLAASLVSRKAS